MITVIDALAIFFLLLSWWIAVSSYPRLPASIPLHFDLYGEADNWGGRWTILLLPVINTLVFVLEYWLFGYALTTKQMPAAMKLPVHLLWLEVNAIFAFLTWRISQVAFGRARGLGRWFLPVALLVVFITCGWLMLAGR
jgi:hypothetical protein